MITSVGGRYVGAQSGPLSWERSDGNDHGAEMCNVELVCNSLRPRPSPQKGVAFD